MVRTASRRRLSSHARFRWQPAALNARAAAGRDGHASGIGKSTLARKFLPRPARGGSSSRGATSANKAVQDADGIIDMLTGVIAAPPAEVDALAARVHPADPAVPCSRDQAIRGPANQSPAPDPAELRRRGFHAGRCYQAVAFCPLVLFVDDAHWGDNDSIAFLGELIHHADQAILVVLAHRPEDYLGVVAKLKNPQTGVRRGDVSDLEVKTLDETGRAVPRQSARGGLGSPDQDDHARAEHIVKAGAGNPLILSELTQSPLLAPIEDLVGARAGRRRLKRRQCLQSRVLRCRYRSRSLRMRRASWWSR
jgi:hypothetical protein